jgi:hypothetical protein
MIQSDTAIAPRPAAKNGSDRLTATGASRAPVNPHKDRPETEPDGFRQTDDPCNVGQLRCRCSNSFPRRRPTAASSCEKSSGPRCAFAQQLICPPCPKPSGVPFGPNPGFDTLALASGLDRGDLAVVSYLCEIEERAGGIQSVRTRNQDPQYYGGDFRATESRTRSTRLRAAIFSMMRERWLSTVRTLMSRA